MRAIRCFLLLSLSVVQACGGVAPSAGKKTPKAEPVPTKPFVGEGIALSALEFGAYLPAAPNGLAAKQVSVEYGYFDMRQQKMGDKADIKDFRFKQAVVYVQDAQFPAKSALGCAEVTAVQGKENPAKAVTFSGGIDASPTFTAGRASVEGKDTATTIDVTKTLKATITGASGDAYAVVETPVMPTAGAIQLAQATDANVTVNTFVSDINSHLDEATTDLLIGDVGGASKNYNLVVVTFYGSASSKVKHVRCALPPNGSATLPKSLYKDLLPLQAFVGHFANIKVETKNGVTTWTAAVAGQGAEDLTIE